MKYISVTVGIRLWGIWIALTRPTLKKLGSSKLRNMFSVQGPWWEITENNPACDKPRRKCREWACPLYFPDWLKAYLQAYVWFLWRAGVVLVIRLPYQMSDAVLISSVYYPRSRLIHLSSNSTIKDQDNTRSPLRGKGLWQIACSFLVPPAVRL